jgi:hypothetical protein
MLCFPKFQFLKYGYLILGNAIAFKNLCEIALRSLQSAFSTKKLCQTKMMSLFGNFFLILFCSKKTQNYVLEEA